MPRTEFVQKIKPSGRLRRSGSGDMDGFFLQYVAGGAVSLPLTSPALIQWRRNSTVLPAGLYPEELWLSDPGVVAKIISAGWARHARPASMGAFTPMQFLDILGTRYVSNLVQDSPILPAHEHEDDFGRLWAHFISVAFVSANLASMDKLSPNCIEGHFYCGLCHDLGFVLELLYEGRRSSGFSRQMLNEHLSDDDSKHEKLGRALSKSWTLPPQLAGTVSAHHLQHESSKADELQQALRRVALADTLFHETKEEWLVTVSNEKSVCSLTDVQALSELYTAATSLQDRALHEPLETTKLVRRNLYTLRNRAG
jgi:HD-like signal output (HDOD) protein